MVSYQKSMYVIPHGMTTIPKNSMLGVTPFLAFRFYCEMSCTVWHLAIPRELFPNCRKHHNSNLDLMSLIQKGLCLLVVTRLSIVCPTSLCKFNDCKVQSNWTIGKISTVTRGIDSTLVHMRMEFDLCHNWGGGGGGGGWIFFTILACCLYFSSYQSLCYY